MLRENGLHEGPIIGRTDLCDPAGLRRNTFCGVLVVRLYLIPGMGVDGRLFERQRAMPLDVRVIEWIEPAGDERFSDYARRLADGIDASEPFYLGGVSLGGMAALEVARHVRPRALFLISSCCGPTGIPEWYRIPGQIACRLPPRVSRLMAALGVILPWPFGPMSWAVRRSLLRMVWEAPPERVAWQMRAILAWEAPAACGVPVFQIHGRHDRMLPARLGKHDLVVDGAGHLLNMTDAGRVNRFIMARINEVEAGSGGPSRVRAAPGAE